MLSMYHPNTYTVQFRLQYLYIGVYLYAVSYFTEKLSPKGKISFSDYIIFIPH